MLPEFRRRRSNRPGRGAEVDRRADDWKRAVCRVLERRKHPVFAYLRVFFEVAVIADDFEEEVIATKEVPPECGRLRREDAVKARDELHEVGGVGPHPVK